jgi:hypothetical protein
MYSHILKLKEERIPKEGSKIQMPYSENEIKVRTPYEKRHPERRKNMGRK